VTLVIPLSEPLDLLALHAADPVRFPCLLESVAHGGNQSSLDFLFAANGEALLQDADGRLQGVGAKVDGGGFLCALERWYRDQRNGVAAAAEPGIPFHGGWVLLLGYELAAEIEPRLKLPRNPLGVPRALALRVPLAIVRDRSNGRMFAAIESGFEAWGEALLRELPATRPIALLDGAVGRVREQPAARYRRGIERIIGHIAAGDVFQVNLSRPWRASWDAKVPPSALYAALRRSNPAPFAGLLQWGDVALASSSPERLVEVRGDRVQTRPIAGTRPRFAGDDDAARVRELIDHPKERAEHIMLIDLERNDLGRVSVPGSVRVDELMSVESYAHVHHIVSNVRATLREGVTPIDVIRAVFPGGTITGCPKVRCMEIIAELEGEGRGFYTGALGYLGVDGTMDLNILIRSITVCGDALEFRAGAGIVADSIAEREIEETRAKARGLVRAIDPEAE
jgi:anthranilate synthase component 1